MKRIAIVGLGQIGGSIVLTLRKKNKRYSITGIDTSSKRLRLLKPLLDQASIDWEAAVQADITVVCLHFNQTADFLRQSGPDSLVMDVCSGKSKLNQLANRKKLRFIGGHPMAGNEFAGEKGWRDDLFENTPFFICPSNRSSRNDLNAVRNFIKDVGGRPVVVDALQHDRFVSIASHFPAVLAGLLKKTGETVPSNFKGPGFQSMTRLAATSPDLMKTFLESNGENMLRSAKQMKKLLDQWIKDSKLNFPQR